jgi:antitoxin Phd
LGLLSMLFSYLRRSDPGAPEAGPPVPLISAIIGILAITEGLGMITISSVEAQTRFGELIDRSQREPVEVTRRGRTVAYVVSPHDMQELSDLRKRREEAARWYSAYRRQVEVSPEASALTDQDVDRLVHELR